MRRTAIAMISFILSVIPVPGATRTMEMPDLVRPAIIMAGEGRLFILEETKIRIYSLEDLALIKTFGRRGEGPSEFLTRPYGPPMSMSLNNGQLAVNSMNKLSFFTLEGKFVRMVRTSPNLVFYPFGEKYIAVGPVGEESTSPLVSFVLMDPELKREKILLKTDVDVNFQDIDIPMNAFTHRPFSGDRIFLPLGRYIPHTYYPLLYTIYQDRFYSLVENEEEEVRASE